MDNTGAVILHRKGEQPKLGNQSGTWEGRPEFFYRALPNGEMLSFNLDSLKLEDFNAMRYNSQINASLTALTFIIHQADWHIECDTPRIKEMVEDNVRQVWTRLVRAIGQAFWAGYSPSILEYENDPQGRYTIINKVKDLSPFEAKVHWKKHERRGGKSYYTFDGIDWLGQGHVDALHAFWYPALMENGNHYGRKILKPAYAPWYFSQIMHIYANRYYERFGEPLPVGRAPFEEEIVEPDGTRITGKQIMLEIVENVRNRGAVVLPSASGDGPGDRYDYNLDYLESNMRGIDFERYMSRLDEEMSLALFTPVLLMRNADVGSHSLGVQHVQTYMMQVNAILGDMKEYIDRFICERLKAINFSPKAPRCEWVPRKLGKESTETTRAIISALIQGDKAKVDLDELGQYLGMNVTEVRQVREMEADSEREVDDRDRAERGRSREGRPRNADSDPSPGRNTITSRVRTQVATNWSSGVIHIEDLNQFEKHIMGVDAGYLDGVIEGLRGLPVEEFGDIDTVMATFERGLANAQAAS